MQLIEPTQSIDVTFLPLLIFGPPGSAKTSIAQTADNPITLDFDVGIHRSFNRKRAVRFDSWAEVLQAGPSGLFSEYSTIVVDTVGRALDMMIPVIAAQSAKFRGPSGLSPQGWGVLGGAFAQWIKSVRDMGKDLILVCHEETGQNAGGDPVVHPDMPGKMSWKEIHKWTDLIGRVKYVGSQRHLDFNPDEIAPCCKNAAGWPSMALPKLEDKPRFLAELIADAKKRIGKTADASAAVAVAVGQWETFLGADPKLEEVNARLPELNTMEKAVKAQVFHLIRSRMEMANYYLDPQTRRFAQKAKKETAVAP